MKNKRSGVIVGLMVKLNYILRPNKNKLLGAGVVLFIAGYFLMERMAITTIDAKVFLKERAVSFNQRTQAGTVLINLANHLSEAEFLIKRRNKKFRNTLEIEYDASEHPVTLEDFLETNDSKIRGFFSLCHLRTLQWDDKRFELRFIRTTERGVVPEEVWVKGVVKGNQITLYFMNDDTVVLTKALLVS